MKTKTYTSKDSVVTYGYSLKTKKWEFKAPAVNFTYLCMVPTRSEGAEKIANIISGSIKRCNAVDGMARANIARYATY